MGEVPLNVLSLPMGADPENDRVVGWDELGREIKQSMFGAQYFIETQAPTQRKSAIKGAARALWDDPAAAVADAVKGVALGTWDAMNVPARALNGEPVTYGDALNAASLVTVGGFPMQAPAGSLRAGALRTYHGTNAEPFDVFDASKFGSKTDPGLLGRGAYLSTDPNVGRAHANTLTFDVTLKNPLEVSYPKWQSDKTKIVREALGLTSAATAEEITSALKVAGHDGVTLDYSPVGYNHKEVMVIDPSSAKRLTAGQQTQGKILDMLKSRGNTQ